MILHTDSLPIGVIRSHSQRLMMEVSASSARGGLSRSSSKERTVVEDSRDPDGFCPYHWSPRTSSFTINVAPPPRYHPLSQLAAVALQLPQVPTVRGKGEWSLLWCSPLDQSSPQSLVATLLDRTAPLWSHVQRHISLDLDAASSRRPAAPLADSRERRRMKTCSATGGPTVQRREHAHDAAHDLTAHERTQAINRAKEYLYRPVGVRGRYIRYALSPFRRPR